MLLNKKGMTAKPVPISGALACNEWLTSEPPMAGSLFLRDVAEYQFGGAAATAFLDIYGTPAQLEKLNPLRLPYVAIRHSLY